jgi:RimJ/RimL family protein N-acetyltransferase
MKDIALDYSRYFWQGKKVRLRPLRIEDAEQAFVNFLDSPSRQLLQLGVELPTSVDLLKGKFEKLLGCQEVDGVIVFAVENLDGIHAGGISLHSCDEKNGVFSFGIMINRQNWGQGYAVDAVQILLKYGFWERRYQKCNSACLHINRASIRLHQKLGFLEEGRQRRVTFFNGEYYDSILFGMLREEFDAQQEK